MFEKIKTQEDLHGLTEFELARIYNEAEEQNGFLCVWVEAEVVRRGLDVTRFNARTVYDYFVWKHRNGEYREEEFEAWYANFLKK